MIYILAFTIGFIFGVCIGTKKARRIITKLRGENRQQADEILRWVGEFIRASGKPPEMSQELIDKCSATAHGIVRRLAEQRKEPEYHGYNHIEKR